MLGIFAGIYYCYPKLTGRLMSEKLGQLALLAHLHRHQPHVLPDALLRAGRHAAPHLPYDANQGFDTYNLDLVATAPTCSASATLIFIWNFIRSRKKGAVAGHNPWNAPSLEWSIPSPPPDYNFAVIPTVSSRYPLWDHKGHVDGVPRR